MLMICCYLLAVFFVLEPQLSANGTKSRNNSNRSNIKSNDDVQENYRSLISLASIVGLPSSKQYDDIVEMNAIAMKVCLYDIDCMESNSQTKRYASIFTARHVHITGSVCVCRCINYAGIVSKRLWTGQQTFLQQFVYVGLLLIPLLHSGIELYVLTMSTFCLSVRSPVVSSPTTNCRVLEKLSNL